VTVTLGFAGTLGAGVIGTGITGAGATGTGTGVIGTAGAGVGADGIGSGAGAVAGGLVGGATGTGMTGVGGVTGFMGNVRGSVALVFADGGGTSVGAGFAGAGGVGTVVALGRDSSLTPVLGGANGTAGFVVTGAGAGSVGTVVALGRDSSLTPVVGGIAGFAGAGGVAGLVVTGAGTGFTTSGVAGFVLIGAGTGGVAGLGVATRGGSLVVAVPDGNSFGVPEPRPGVPDPEGIVGAEVAVGADVRRGVCIAAGPGSKAEIDGMNAGVGFAVVVEVVGAGTETTGGVTIVGAAGFFLKIRPSSPGFFSGSCSGIGIGAGADTVVGRFPPVSRGSLIAPGVVFTCVGIDSAGRGCALALAGGSRAFVAAFVSPTFSVSGCLIDALLPATGAFAGAAGIVVLSSREKTSPVFMSLTSDRYDPSGCFSVLRILTCRGEPFSKFRVITSPILGGPAGAFLPPWAQARPTAAEIPNTPAQTHRFQNQRIMADSVQHPSRAGSTTEHAESVRRAQWSEDCGSRSLATNYIGLSGFAG
jgi:hypothetical protein